MKKILATLLALVLVLAMCAPAMAANLTINNAYRDTRFNAYEMMKLEVGNGSYNYTIVNGWETFLNDNGYLSATKPTTGDVIPVIANGANMYLVIADMAEFASKAEAYVVANGATADATATATANRKAEFTGLENGYYLILTVDAEGNILDAKTPLALTVLDTAEINEKNAYPQMDKVVRESEASIGDTVTFDIHLKMSAAGENYVVHDQMEEGFTFKKITSVEYEGKQLVENVDYVLVENTDDDCTFHVELTDPTAPATWIEGGRLVITYTAELDQDAVIHDNEADETVDDTNDNTAWLTFTDDSGAQELPPVTTQTSTYQFSLVKTTNANVLLDGAEFKMKDSSGKVIKVVAVEGGYRVADSADTEPTTVIAVTGGQVMISGLGNDTYTLTETKAPTGYNLLQNPVTIEINGANNPATVVDGVWTQGGLQVINQTGSELPSTGGMGTTVFYVVGGLMMAAAVVLLVAKKKVSGRN